MMWLDPMVPMERRALLVAELQSAPTARDSLAAGRLERLIERMPIDDPMRESMHKLARSLREGEPPAEDEDDE